MAVMSPAGSLCWVDGLQDGALSPFDRGLAFGDGVFETMRFGAFGIPLLEYHLRRLGRGCERLGIALDSSVVRAEIAAALVVAGARLASGVLKLVITRGTGLRGYRCDPTARSTRVLMATPLPEIPPDWPSDGVAVRFCDMRLGSNPVLAGIKHLNRLEQVLARREWDDPEVAEGLLADARGRIVEGVATNFFIGSSGRLVTPVIDNCGVAGVMREYILEHAVALAGVPVSEAACERALLGGAQELFLCNAVIGVWPVRMLAGKVLPVGPLTRRIQSHVAALFGA